ncbi:LutC/YkgG family protein [Janibacter sp. G56]|uniref:LutC/YkgG family protein n=1 Tax=Janibacter sp. G56 TaxID=3418717 RepID=UPI003D035DDA
MTARDEILARVRAAVTDVTSAPAWRVPIEADPSGPAAAPDEATVALFAEVVADYRATVVRARADEVGTVVAAALREAGCRSVVVPAGLEPVWRNAIGEVAEVHAEADITADRDLDAIDGVVTGAAVGIAVTGTIVLDHAADQGRRALTLVPDTHVCVVREDQIVHDVPEAVFRLRPADDGARPLTWISGPSATSDIELERVEGVHGPRTLIVVIVGS